MINQVKKFFTKHPSTPKSLSCRYVDYGERGELGGLPKNSLKNLFPTDMNKDYSYEEAIKDIREKIIEGILDIDIVEFDETVDKCKQQTEKFVQGPNNKKQFRVNEAGALLLYTWESSKKKSLYQVMNKVLRERQIQSPLL